MLSPNLEGKYIFLETARAEHSSFCCDLRENPEISIFFPTFTGTQASQRQWIENTHLDPTQIFLVMTTKDNHTPIGTLSLYNIRELDNGTKECDFGRFASVGNPFQNIEACIIAINLAFFTYGINTINLAVLKSNTRVVSLWRNFDPESASIDVIGTEPVISFRISNNQFKNLTLPKMNRLLKTNHGETHQS